MGAKQPARAGVGKFIERRVSFRVANTNRSGVACATNGGEYAVHGHLVGRRSKLRRGQPKSVTLYLHGLELGEWFWRFGAVPGFDHARAMARRGHVSVTIDRLGYNESDQPPGQQSCVGGQADVAHQVVEQLRSARYDVPRGKPYRFRSVALAGHSLGGAITQVEAYSFKDVDAIAVLSFADNAFTPAVLSTALRWGPLCLAGGERSERGSPGYAYLTGDEAGFRANFLAAASPPVTAAALPLRDRNPCGDMESLAQSVLIDELRLREIDVPVLILSGSEDRVFDPERVRAHGSAFGGSPDVAVHILDGATHGLTLEPTAPEFRRLLSGWLGARGF